MDFHHALSSMGYRLVTQHNQYCSPRQACLQYSPTTLNTFLGGPRLPMCNRHCPASLHVLNVTQSCLTPRMPPTNSIHALGGYFARKRDTAILNFNFLPKSDHFLSQEWLSVSTSLQSFLTIHYSALSFHCSIFIFFKSSFMRFNQLLRELPFPLFPMGFVFKTIFAILFCTRQ